MTSRLTRFWHSLRGKPLKPEKLEQDDCPIAIARRASVVGENAPLGWLTNDFLGPEVGAPSRENKLSVSATQDSQEALTFLQPDPEDSDYLFNEEWFLSPCG